MIKRLRKKLLGTKEPIQVVKEEVEDVTVLDTEKISYQKTYNDLQQESSELEQIQEEEFLDLRTTRSIKVEYEEVISKLDSIVNLVEENTAPMNTYEELKLSSTNLVEEAPLDIVEVQDVNETADINSLIKDHKQMLIAESDEIKRNSDTFLINEGMFDLNSQLHNAKLIISDTEIPQAITKKDILEN